MADHLSDRDFVRDTVTRADRARRDRSALARVARVAPWAGAASLGVAAAVRAGGAPAWIAVTALTAAALVVGAWFMALRRTIAEPDAVATRVDGDAGLGGELRSADWFTRHADRARPDAWIEFHVRRAAERMRGVDWDALYAPVRARRAWGLTVAAAAGALALALTTPVPDRSAQASALLAADELQGDVLGMLPPELQAQLEELLRRMGEGGEAGEVAEATLAELRELMENIDPAFAAKLAELAKDALESAEAAQAGEQPPNADEDMAKNTSAGLPEDVRWAIDDLAERLANASRDRQTAENNPSASEETGEMGSGSEQAASAEASAADAQMKMTREAAADPGAAKMMMGGAGAMGGDSRPGAGGNNPAANGNALDPLSIAQALRQELVEASADTKGTNVEMEDLRRKTEQGEANVGFTRVQPPSTLDRSRAQAPPIVPDSYRVLLFNYFMREK